MRLLGLLKQRLCPVPEEAVATVHVDVTIVEEQGVRLVTVPWERTRRPIVATAANMLQPTRVIATRGGQVEVVGCVGCRRDTGINTDAVVFKYCT